LKEVCDDISHLRLGKEREAHEVKEVAEVVKSKDSAFALKPQCVRLEVRCCIDSKPTISKGLHEVGRIVEYQDQLLKQCDPAHLAGVEVPPKHWECSGQVNRDTPQPIPESRGRPQTRAGDQVVSRSMEAQGIEPWSE